MFDSHCPLQIISIHALREEGDADNIAVFLEAFRISIHALREEGDCGQCTGCRLRKHFYPRPPRGGRRLKLLTERYAIVFLSTPSARRATVDCWVVDVLVSISIHALREEGDRQEKAIASLIENFYPRPPRGGRQGGSFTVDTSSKFLSTPSARRATGEPNALIARSVISIHALREEGDKNRVRRW